MSAKTECAWCFPGLQLIDGELVSHGMCPRHLKQFNALMWFDAWKINLELELIKHYAEQERQCGDSTILWIQFPRESSPEVVPVRVERQPDNVRR